MRSDARRRSRNQERGARNREQAKQRPRAERFFCSGFRAHGSGLLSSHGFTLVELLVALTLVALMASLVFSASKGFVRQTRTVICANNLHQIGTAWANRKADRAEELLAGLWPGELYRYVDAVDEVYVCPEGAGEYLGSLTDEIAVPIPGTPAGSEHFLEITTLGGGGRLSLNQDDSFWVWNMTDETMAAYWYWNGRAHNYQQNLEWYRSDGHDQLPPNPTVYWKPIEDMAATDKTTNGGDGDFMDAYVRFEQLSDGKLSVSFLWASDQIGPSTKSPPAWPHSYVPGYTIYRHNLLDNNVVQRTNVGVYTEPYIVDGYVPGHTEYYTREFELPALSYGLNVAAVSGDDPETILVLDYHTALANDGEAFAGTEDEGLAARHCDGGVDKANVLWADGSVRLAAPADIDPDMRAELWGP